MGLQKASLLSPPGVWAVPQLRPSRRGAAALAPGSAAEPPRSAPQPEERRFAGGQTDGPCELTCSSALFSPASPLGKCCSSFCMPSLITTAQLLQVISARVKNNLPS